MEKTSVKSKFIVFEGIDGSGKSTQCSLLYNFILSQNIPARLLAEPTAGEYGKMIRKMLQGETAISVKEQIQLFMDDRQQDCELNINPCIEKGITIVMDRYFYSNAAYQGSQNFSPAEIIKKNINRGFPLPDRVYYIDIEPAEALKRIMTRNGTGKTDLFEKKTFLDVVRDNFLSFIDERFFKIDGNLSPEVIFSIIKNDYISLIS